LGSVYLSEEFCDDFSPEIQIDVTYPYNMLIILRHFFSNHTLLEDINAALELDYVLKAKLLPLAIERSEYDEILAAGLESRLDFETAINASKHKAKIYDSLTTVVWQKMLAMATANTEFHLLSGFDWSIVICMVITILNTFAITILYLRLKAISMSMPVVGIRGARADFIFSLPPTTITYRGPPRLRPPRRRPTLGATIIFRGRGGSPNHGSLHLLPWGSEANPLDEVR